MNVDHYFLTLDLFAITLTGAVICCAVLAVLHRLRDRDGDALLALITGAIFVGVSLYEFSSWQGLPRCVMAQLGTLGGAIAAMFSIEVHATWRRMQARRRWRELARH